MQQIISYNRQELKVACDEKCHKAWGVQNRPKIKLSNDDDDVMFLSDQELGQAPVNPGTYEGGEGKPQNKIDIPNKWCVRECERCSWSKPGKSTEPVELKDWSKRRVNQPWKHATKLKDLENPECICHRAEPRYCPMHNDGPDC